MSVYFARVKGYVKIGYSADPIGRIGSITTGTCLKPDDVTYGDSVELLGWVPGDRKVEKSTHRQFAGLKVIGEWFWDDDAYDELIESHDFGVPFYDTPWTVVRWMEKYPTIPRVEVAKVYEIERANELDDPDSVVNQVNRMFGTQGSDWSGGHAERLAAERAADRAHWRSLKASA